MASGTSWDVIIGSIASFLAIHIFITGRTSLADLFGQKKTGCRQHHSPASQGALNPFS